MCGISGIINKNQNLLNKAEIEKINNLIIHRGPDDEGYYFGKNFAFGHRRLSIIDLSEAGHQPMQYLDKYTITYNGEIYNYIEIKEELIKDGYKFNSNTDTEVILASYDKWGFGCVNKFNGMWAFAIYDKTKEIIFCSRDRFGIKPFYYTEVDNKFIFGSEIKQLLEFYDDNRFVNKNILMDYLIVGYENHTNETFFKNIFELQQSHNLIYDLKKNKFETERYYDIKKEDYIGTEEETVTHYKKVMYDAISLRLRSDVKVGTCLSGGLDSSSIASIASKKYRKKNKDKFIAIHAKSMQNSNDESFYAKEVSKYCDLNLNIIEPTSKEFIDAIEEVVYTQEEPFGSPSIFMQYFVMKKAKEIGCGVMLDGQGGDETLLGYERYYPAYLMSLKFYDFIRGVINSSNNSKLSIKQLIMYFVYFTNSKVRIKKLKNKNGFIKDKYFNKINKNILEENSKSYLNIYNLQYIEIYQTQLPHLLRYEDRNSMRNSIETRLPFIDYKVLETALSINHNYKIKGGWTKYLLRKTVDGILPKNITWRKNKFGFEAPVKMWISDIDEKMKKAVAKSNIIRTITNNLEFDTIEEKQKWKYFNIAVWEQIYNVKID